MTNPFMQRERVVWLFNCELCPLLPSLLGTHTMSFFPSLSSLCHSQSGPFFSSLSSFFIIMHSHTHTHTSHTSHTSHTHLLLEEGGRIPQSCDSVICRYVYIHNHEGKGMHGVASSFRTAPPLPCLLACLLAPLDTITRTLSTCTLTHPHLLVYIYTMF